MKFDMQTIDKLRPPGLLNLEVLARVIYVLEELIVRHMHDATKVLKLARLLGRISQQDRENRNFNLNLKIKMWVMQCPHRIAWVRSVIGERAIKRWRARYDSAVRHTASAGTEFAMPISAWQTAPLKPMAPNARSARNARKQRQYAWKRFALYKVSDFVTEPDRESQPCAEHADANWLLSREARVLKPVEFHPDELVPEAATGIPAREDEEDENAKPEHVPKKTPRITPGITPGQRLEQSPKQTGEPPSGQQKGKPP